MRDLPSLKSLRAFEAAARNGSLTAAADELCIGQVRSATRSGIWNSISAFGSSSENSTVSN